ncbi:hypothetical protein N7461_006834 [Penicillium sp. DV-2018c]|nr:hypothetical protein N7461_006834 [Penicillium sp. DV-2018c]
MDSPGSQLSPPPTPAPVLDAGHESEQLHGRRRRRHRRRQRQRQHVERSTSSHPRRERNDSQSGGLGEDIAEENEPSVGGEANPETKVAEGEANAENLGFIVDVQGDRNITRYGANQYETSAYHRTGGNSVVGLPDKRIDPETRHDHTLVTVPADAVAPSTTRLLSTLNPSTLYTNPPIPVANRRAHPIPDSPAADVDDSANFISIESPPPVEVASGAGGPDTECSPTVVPDTFIEDEDEAEAIREKTINRPVPPVDPKIREMMILRRNAKLTREVKKNPLNVRAWIRLAEHQELVILGARPDSRPLTNEEKHGVVSAILSIYDNALKANPRHPARDRLVLGRIEQGAKVWDPEELSNQWEQVLRSDSESISVWVEYLDHCQTNPQKFDFDTCFGTYLLCLDTHSRVGSGPDRYLITSYLFLRLTVFLREAGYLERAVGYWQAVLEFVVCRPSGLAANHEEALETFNKFWSPAYVKIGEPGWQAWNTDHDPNSLKSHVDSDHEPRECPAHSFKAWTSAERVHMMWNRMPTHEFDLVDKEGDLLEVSLLADCTRILEYFRDFVGTVGVALLIDAFLQFCHLPHLTYPANLHTSRLWIGENFLRNQFMDDWQNTIGEWIEFQDYAASTTVRPFAFSHHTFIPTTDNLFSQPEMWFSCLAKWAENGYQQTCVNKPDFVVNTLFSLAQIVDESRFCEYAIAVFLACDRDGAKKRAKALLEQDQDDIRLWNALALVNWGNGHKQSAQKVWSTALFQTQELPDKDFVETALLWNSWIWATLQAGENEKAAYLLKTMPFKRVWMGSYRAADRDELETTDILRLTRFLGDVQWTALRFRRFQAYVAYTDCLAISRYLLGASFGETLKFYDDALKLLSDKFEHDAVSRAFGSELLHQARAKLVYHYITTKPAQYRPLDVHNILLGSLETFPHNTMFLALLKWNDARMGVTHRIRDIFDATIGEKARAAKHSGRGRGAQIDRVPITTHFFNIYCEMGRPVLGNSSTHLVRAAFERAIDHGPVSVGKTPAPRHRFELISSTSAQNNITIWKLYVLWEAHIERNYTRAREVLFRALRACPWAKELYMLAFEHLREDIVQADITRLSFERTRRAAERTHRTEKVVGSGFGKIELQALYSEMLRRGLRINHRLADVDISVGDDD